MSLLLLLGGSPTGTTATEAWELIETQTGSGGNRIDFTDLSADYYMYVLKVSNMSPGTDTQLIQLRTSSDNGSSFDNGASDYAYAYEENEHDTAETQLDTGDDADVRIRCAEGAGNDTNEMISGTVYVFNPMGSGFTHFIFEFCQEQADGEQAFNVGAGVRLEAAQHDAFHIKFGGGTVATGTYRLYGLKAS